MLFSTRSPPAVQRIPWPTRDDSDEEEALHQKTLARYDTWLLNDEELPWLVEPDGEYTGIFHVYLFLKPLASVHISDGHRSITLSTRCRDMGDIRWKGLFCRVG
jgi:hypothetical protein